MDSFNYRDGQLHCDNININKLAEKIPTPFYLYSKTTIHDHFNKFRDAFAALNPLICYSVKNCSNIHILKILTNKGAGMDVVSGGELFRAIRSGANPEKIVYAGVGKSIEEIKRAIELNIGWINIESEEELYAIHDIASEMQKEVNVAIRINPNVYDPKTHIKTATGIQDTKFGVDLSHAKKLYVDFMDNKFVKLRGIHIHIGSPIYSVEPYKVAISKILDFIEELKKEGVNINMIDLGGGYLAQYDGTEEVKSWTEYSDVIVPLLLDFVEQGGQIIMEPGRSITANAGILVAKVLYRKQGVHKKFIIVNTGMSHLIRPSFYDAYHFIWPVNITAEYEIDKKWIVSAEMMKRMDRYDIVGPICESSDFLAKDRPFPPVKKDDLIAIFTAGSYAMTMASQYNSIPRPAEILVSANYVQIIRERETYEDIIALERCTPII